jgi:hypothetical protein
MILAQKWLRWSTFDRPSCFKFVRQQLHSVLKFLRLEGACFIFKKINLGPHDLNREYAVVHRAARAENK